jgi:hypothetical protein
MDEERILIVFVCLSIGSRREIKTRGHDAQRLNALEQLKRARQGGQAPVVEQVN